ncbi:hypothetical protein JYU34_022501 [Plutella xylostella]|uniref:DUF4780 domain-containing protein n=1 Tax=Plutella xylostella TaxID=51655 RepID=A0ABQ7PPX9_PLUXY|nr:hypothetical protein JYU34_022501 [Plutella xylostella]
MLKASTSLDDEDSITSQNENIENEDPNATVNSEINIPVIRRRSRNPPELQEASNEMKRAFSSLNSVLSSKKQKIDSEDDCDLYGKLLAKMLRQFTDLEKQELIIAPVKINNESRSPPVPAGTDRGAPGGPGDPAVDGAPRTRHRMSGSARRRLHRRRMREEAARLAAVPLADIAARVTPSSAAAGGSNEYDRGSATVTRGHTGGSMPAGGQPLPTPARPIPASSTATHKAPTSVAHLGASQKGCPRLVPGGGQPKTPANTSARVKRMQSDEKVSPAAGGTRGPPKRACLARPKDPQSASLNYAGALKAHLIAVIVAADWRELSPDQMTIIRRAVELKHSEAVNDLTRDVVPAFDHFPQQLARGGLKLRCCDDYTLNWLKETVSSLPPLWDGGCQLKVVAASEMPSYIMGAM